MEPARGAVLVDMGAAVRSLWTAKVKQGLWGPWPLVAGCDFRGSVGLTKHLQCDETLRLMPGGALGLKPAVSQTDCDLGSQRCLWMARGSLAPITCWEKDTLPDVNKELLNNF